MRSTAIKRAIDIIGSGIGLAIAALPMAAIAIAIRRSMGSPVLFRQERPGRDGRAFTLVKFRTMRDGEGTDAERLTSVGRFLRSTSLDELPELWNVLRGDMSLVGPRPLLVRYLDRYSPRQARRHEVRPGLTGLAQVSGRNAVGWDERFELDVQYVEGWTIGGDLRIMARTVLSVVRRDGIAGDDHETMPEFLGNHEGSSR
jgi:lipopolysaccharide/colanic/teichoic acid biosynthesis glycosyltransferase